MKMFKKILLKICFFVFIKSYNYIDKNKDGFLTKDEILKTFSKK